MTKEVHAFSLIIFLFVVLAAWWALFAFETPTQSQIAYNNAFVPQGPITIYHSNAQGSEVYSGSLNVPNCAQFLTGISTIGQAPTHLHLALTISKSANPCQVPNTDSQVPFTVSFSSNSNVKPILDSVKVNNAAAAFTVVEVK